MKFGSAMVASTQSFVDRLIARILFLSRLKNRELLVGFALMFVIGSLGIALTTQGWRSRTPAHDLVPHIINARNLATHGTIPIHGDTGSYGSYKPAGTAWLMLPSTLLFADPRLSEYVGAALLYLATLAGIFLLAYRYFGFWCACLAVIIYGLSSTGIFLAASLWPNGRPDFFIWIIYFASQWVWHRDPKYLAIAGAIWGFGMNVDMALLPAIFILPALWLVYRPPIQFRPLIIAISLVLIVWSPYLRFEAGRGFADIRSQLLLQNIFPANFRGTWCDPSIPLQELGSTAQPIPLGFTQPQTYQGPHLMQAALVLTEDISGKLMYNFQDAASVPLFSGLFVAAVLSSLILLNVTGYIPRTNEISLREPFWKDRTTQFALLLILIGVLTNEFVIAHLLGIHGGFDFSNVVRLRTIEKLLILGGGCILAVKWTTVLVDRLFQRAGIQIQSKEDSKQKRLMVLSLAIPWFVLLLVAEPGKPERFWWLWPLQAIFLSAFILWILPRFRIPRPFINLIAILVVVIVWWNPFLLQRLNTWKQVGWAGAEAPVVQTVNYVASDLKREGKTQAAIGYHVFIYQFMAAYNITNPEYKAGMDFDLLFKYPHGITNTDRCAEGFSPSDEYLVVQTQPQDGVGTPRLYFDVPLDANFKLVGQFGTYQVYKRQSNHVANIK